MKKHQSAHQWFSLLAVASVLTFALSGCSGDDGSQGPPGPPGTTVGVASPSDATALTITVTGVAINSAPVVNFTVTNQNGVAVSGFADTDLRFNIAKLVPGTNGDPSKWQSYLNRVSGGGVLGTQERAGSTSAAWGKLVDHKNGTYTYTFCTDITNNTGTPDFTKCSTASQPNICPAPCTDADGNALDISYQPNLTTRIGIQQNNTALPKANATFDFVPAGGAVSTTREIVTTASCNECHNQLAAHGGGMRIETKLCVTCHNPGSWFNTPGNIQTVDFKVMIHKIHMGDELPSVVGPDGILNDNPATVVDESADNGTYKLGNADFSDVVFPQDIRNCTKCHDGADAATPQGDNWKNRPSMEACGSCHDDVYFGASPDPLKPYQTVSHAALSGVSDPDNSMCLVCHAAGKPAGSIAEKHSLPELLKAEGAKYKLKIVSVTNTAPLSMPTITFSITNAADTPYDIAATPAITGGSMSLLIGWNTTDINNDGRSNAQPISISLLSSGALAGTVTNNGDGTYSVTSTTAIPAGATGSGRAGFHARMSVDVDGNATADRIEVKSVVKDFIITGSSVVARRTVVDIAKCNQCHARLSLHGGARTDEPQLCVMCHNPNATDTARRPAGAPTGTLDNKKEESIDFKRMIHGIHAGLDDPTTDTMEGRQKGLVVYGFFSAPATENPVDFSHVRFPGILKDCATCHTTSSYQLTGVWQSPTQSGILGSTIDHGASLTDQADDLNISPTAAVCSSCHDSGDAQMHMVSSGIAKFSDTQTTIDSSTEICSICHGPGSVSDVKVRHGVK